MTHLGIERRHIAGRLWCLWYFQIQECEQGVTMHSKNGLCYSFAFTRAEAVCDCTLSELGLVDCDRCTSKIKKFECRILNSLLRMFDFYIIYCNCNQYQNASVDLFIILCLSAK